jgi:putative N6-adenine-specific DNA methylase
MTQTLLQAFFAPCPRGLEAELVTELKEIGIAEARPERGGVAFGASLPQAWRVCLWSRLAVRVLWCVRTGEYHSEDDLYAAARELPWPKWFDADQTIAVHTVARSCPLQSLKFATLRVKDAVCDSFREAVGRRPSVDTRNPAVPLLLHLDAERFDLYLDLAGAPLNRRGYRVEAAEAPINENLAAGMLRLSGWQPGTPLLDPMMGGGTLLLEAAMMALNQAPGLLRADSPGGFAFENLHSFDAGAWAVLREEARAARHAPEPLPLFGMDINPAMLDVAEANFAAAGVEACIALREGDARTMTPPAPAGFIVTNPPYGVRLNQDQPDAERAAFYKALGDRLKQQFSGWTAWIITADPLLLKAIGLHSGRRTPLYNGALECRFCRFDLKAGQFRRSASHITSSRHGDGEKPDQP